MMNKYHQLPFRGGGQKALFGLIALLAFPFLSAAQSDFFEVQTLSQAQLSTSAMLRYTNLQDTNFSKDVKIVATGDVRTLQHDGVLKFLFPGSPDTVVAVAIQIEDNDRVGFTWNGQLLNEPGPADKFYRTIDGIKYDVTETWIPHYSNPDIYYQFLNGSIRTGRPNIHITDNAAQIRRNGCEIAGYRPGQELAVFPTFSPTGCQMGNPITFTANIIEPDEDTPGIGPYTVTWRWNKTGIFNSSGSNSTALGTGNPITITEHPACPTYWVQCKVVSADQVTITRVFRVVRGPICNCYGPPPGDGDDRSVSSISSETSRLYPNPVEAGSFVQVPPHSVWFELTDPKGMVAASGTVSSEGSLQIPAILSAGLYFVRLRMVDGTSQVHKLFTLKPN
jgi:hypothetical protein